MLKKLLIVSLPALFFLKSGAQPFIDLLAFHSQNFFSTYSDSSKNPLFVQDNFLNVFIPKKFGKEHVLLIRVNAEKLAINRSGSNASSLQLYSLALPLGVLLTSRDKKWKYTGIFISRINSDYRDDVSHDHQIAGIGLITYVKSGNIQIRAGLYYSREFFGNFFMPLVGLDWKINSRWQMYGTMPSNYRIECRLSKNVSTGIGFRSFQRSFRLSGSFGNDFIRVKENQVKLFLDAYVYKNLVVVFDVYRSIGYQLPRNDYRKPSLEKPGINALRPFSDNFGFTLGFAYRIVPTPLKNEVK